MKRTYWPAIALALTGPLIAASLQSASATPVHDLGKNTRAHAAQSGGSAKQAAAQPAAFTQYQQVASGLLADPTNSQVLGAVGCPAGMKVLSGGAIISSSSVAENINSSFPSSDGHSWEAWVNNTSGTDGTFVVYAVCARKVAQYSIVTSGLSPDPPGLDESNQIQAVCPKGTVVYGGGGFISSSSPFTMMAAAQPGFDLRTWFSAFNNRSTDTATDQTFAVCGRKLAGYIHVQGQGSSAAPGAQAGAIASCPDGDVVLGGGGGPAVFWDGLTDMNSTGPTDSTTWSYWENNNSSTTVGVGANAICATFSG